MQAHAIDYCVSQGASEAGMESHLAASARLSFKFFEHLFAYPEHRGSGV